MFVRKMLFAEQNNECDNLQDVGADKKRKSPNTPAGKIFDSPLQIIMEVWGGGCEEAGGSDHRRREAKDSSKTDSSPLLRYRIWIFFFSLSLYP